MNSLPTLYKLSKDGSIEVWNISYDDGSYKIDYGQKDGAMQCKINYVSGKNIGKANETTPLEQARLESVSRWNKQIDKGYCKDLSSLTRILLPMLAHKYKDHKNKVYFPAFVQPKLNGVRCLAFWESGQVLLKSRKGKNYSLPLIQEFLEQNMPKTMILDGELYNHQLTLQKINSLVKRKQEESVLIEFHCYDCVENKVFSKRLDTITNFISSFGHMPCPIVLVKTNLIRSHSDIVKFHSRYKEEGYEGSIIRLDNSFYEINSRSYSLLKLKDFQDEEFLILDAIENPNSPGECSFKLATDAGVEFFCKPKGSHEERCQMFANKDALIGKMMTVRFFDWTPDGVPFNPVGICIRDYE